MKIQSLTTLILATLALAVTPTHGQTPAPAQPSATPPGTTFTLRSNARLVILDIVVTDAKGNIVTGLTKDDFNVTELNQPQKVLNFEATGAHSIQPDLNINSTAELDRLAPNAPVNIILLDEFNTRFEDMAFARYSLKKFLEKQPDKLATPTMLLSVSLEKFTVIHDYTQDKQAVIDALDHHFVAYPWQSHQFTWQGERLATAFETLTRVAQATVGHTGHKNMIWIGRGFPPLHFSNLQLDTENRVNNEVQRCVNVLRDARITLYAIDPAGLQVNNSYGAEAGLDDPFGGNYQFNRLATATGGKAFYGRNDVDAEIGTGVRDGSSFYTLAYRPSNSNVDPQKFRKIKVTFNRPDLVATTREGYYVQYAPARVNPQNPSRRLTADLANAESSTMAYDGVPLTLSPIPDEPESYIIRVDPSGLMWYFATDTKPRYTEVIVTVTLFDKKGKEIKRMLAKDIKVNAPADVPPTGRIERGLNLKFKIDHEPKATRARFVVRVTPTGRIGTADADLTQHTSVSNAPATNPAPATANPPTTN